MVFIYKERPSTSPYAQAIWTTEDTSNGIYLAAADGAWDMIFVQQDGQHKVVLSGPSSRATPVRYKKGNRNVGIRFRPGSYFTNLPANTMLDVTRLLPIASAYTFWFDHQTWRMPTFETADDFLDKLARNGLLAKDGLVQTVLQGETPDVGMRSVQRRFLYATGLPPGYHQQIRRAAEAVKMLEKGTSILDVVHQLGYADQAHMTRVVKRLSGCTPGQIIKKVKQARRFHSINGYGVCAQMGVINFNGGINADQTLQNRDQTGPTGRPAQSS